MGEIENPPAFPFPDVRDCEGNGIREGSTGATLRDVFAWQALTGLMAAEAADVIYHPKMVANRAYEIADAMLATRSTSQEAGS